MSDQTESHIENIKNNKDTATRNILIKLDILNHFVNFGIPWQRNDNGDFVRIPNTGLKILDSYPKSAIQFSRWTLDSDRPVSLLNCSYVREDLERRFGKFTSHGQDSLTPKNRPKEYAQAKQLFLSLKKVAKHQLAAENNVDKIRELKTEVERWKAAAQAQATLVIKTIEEKGALVKKARDAERALQQNKMITNDIIANKEALISELIKEIRSIKGFSEVDKVTK